MGLRLVCSNFFLILSSALICQVQQLRWQVIQTYLVTNPPKPLRHQDESRKLLEKTQPKPYATTWTSGEQTQDLEMNSTETTVMLTLLILPLWKHRLCETRRNFGHTLIKADAYLQDQRHGAHRILQVVGSNQPLGCWEWGWGWGWMWHRLFSADSLSVMEPTQKNKRWKAGTPHLN